jgi:serine/threonine protein kinase
VSESYWKPVISDFGSASYVQANSMKAKSCFFTNTVHSAPEFHIFGSNAKRYTQKVDVYSLGMFLLRLLLFYSETVSFQYLLISFYFHCSFLLFLPILISLFCYVYILLFSITVFLFPIFSLLGLVLFQLFCSLTSDKLLLWCNDLNKRNESLESGIRNKIKEVYGKHERVASVLLRMVEITPEKRCDTQQLLASETIVEWMQDIPIGMLFISTVLNFYFSLLNVFIVLLLLLRFFFYYSFLLFLFLMS